MKKEGWKKVRFAAYTDEELINELKKRGYVVLKSSE